MHCQNCGGTVEKDFHFCPKCGKEIQGASSSCEGCGTEFPEGAEFCPTCGADKPIGAEFATPAQPPIPAIASAQAASPISSPVVPENETPAYSPKSDAAPMPPWPQKIFSSHPRPLMELPNLIEVHLASYDWFLKDGLRELFNEVSPIKDYADEGLELSISDFYLDEPKYDEEKAKDNGLSYEAPLRVRARLENKKTKEIKEQEVYIGEFPLMTKRGTFVVNGVERVVTPQLVRSAGVYFRMQIYRGRKLFGAEVIPRRGIRLEFDTDADGAVWVAIDRRRKIPVTAVLRAFGIDSDETITKIFEDVDNSPDIKHIEATLKKDITKNREQGLIEIYRRLRPGELATADDAKQLIEGMFFWPDRYDLAKVGRYKLNQRLGLSTPLDPEHRIFRPEDLVAIIKEIIRLNNDPCAEPDDIDSLSNRRVRTLGELLQNKLRVGIAQMEKNVRDRMSTLDIYTLTPNQLINARPFMAAVKDFFIDSPLSQTMDQVNPLAELEHRRRISVVNPAALTARPAAFEIRKAHASHYGRICPIQIREGADIGFAGRLANYAQLSEFGFLETPYVRIKEGKLTKEVVQMNADDERKFNIAHGGTRYDHSGRIMEKEVEARIKGRPGTCDANALDFIEVAPQQPLSIAATLIPFIEHDNANRAFLGASTQRQAVSCIKPQAPLCSTGFEDRAARDSGQLEVARWDGTVSEMDGDHIVVKLDKPSKENESSLDVHRLHKFVRSNQFTCISQKPLVRNGQRVKGGDVLADGASTDCGQLALGQNLMVAFMSWGGANFKDAIAISERLVKDDRFTSIHIEDFSVDVRDTRLGPEVTTPDIPNVSEEKLRNLDDEGIVRIGTEVDAGDILIGKISPKGEADMTSEERLLRVIFGEKARDVKNTSLTMPKGKHGRVVGVKVFSRERGDKLQAGVIKNIQVEIAQFQKITVGDTIADRHGNKGAISIILPEENMPYLEDGTPVDVILNPLGVASRMNIGQILETHLGWAAHQLGYQAVTPSLAGASEEEIKAELKKAGMAEDGKMALYDGGSGERFQQRVTVGYIYMMKLNHLVEDKIRVRSIGPYSAISQQPLTEYGAQRFAEMGVWALEGYGSAFTLQEMLTIKSDDVTGRAAAFDAIIRGEKIKNPNIPASFYILVNELKALGLSVELLGGEKLFRNPKPEPKY